MGAPGIPGSKDLQYALRRLSWRRSHEEELGERPKNAAGGRSNSSSWSETAPGVDAARRQEIISRAVRKRQPFLRATFELLSRFTAAFAPNELGLKALFSSERREGVVTRGVFAFEELSGL